MLWPTPCWTKIPRGPLMPEVVARALAHVTTPGPTRDEAFNLLMARLHASPRPNPAYAVQWLADLDAPRPLLVEANDEILGTLDEMALTDGGCSALAATWARCPADRRAGPPGAGGADRPPRRPEPRLPGGRRRPAGHARPDRPRARTWRALPSSDDSRARPTIGGAGSSRPSTASATSRDDPALVARARAELDRRFTLAAALRVAAGDPDEDTRRSLVSGLVAWASGQQHAAPFELTQSQALARALHLGPRDLVAVAATQHATTESVRALAQVARRACRGEEWRAFLSGLDVPAAAR